MQSKMKTLFNELNTPFCLNGHKLFVVFFFFCCLRELNSLSGSRTFPIHCFNTAQTLNSFLESIDTGRVVLSKKKYIVKISSCYDKKTHEASQPNFD